MNPQNNIVAFLLLNKTNMIIFRLNQLLKRHVGVYPSSSRLWSMDIRSETHVKLKITKLTRSNASHWFKHRHLRNRDLNLPRWLFFQSIKEYVVNYVIREDVQDRKREKGHDPIIICCAESPKYSCFCTGMDNFISREFS